MENQMRRMMKSFVIASALSALFLGGCGKKEEKVADPAPAPTEPAPTPTTPPEPTPPPADPTPTPAAGADYVKVIATHNPPKPEDPVLIEIQKFAVTKASFDPANLEGGTAELELDLSSIKSDNPKRDGHLQSPDYFDTGKFPKAVVKVDNVKKTNDKTYTADATVDAHGVSVKLPVTFEVLETTPDSVKIHSKQTFKRLGFKVGKPTEGAEADGTADEQTLELQLTIKKV
jgi:polyisoprenoid-binding protein YceI